MTGQKEFLQRLISALDSVGIPYMLSGSMGSSFHGHPRATNDIDVVIHPTPSQLHNLLQTFCKRNADGRIPPNTIKHHQIANRRSGSLYFQTVTLAPEYTYPIRPWVWDLMRIVN